MGAEERRQRFKTAGDRRSADLDAKAAERASDMASKAAQSAATAAVAAKADVDTQKSDEVPLPRPLPASRLPFVLSKYSLLGWLNNSGRV